MQSQDPVQFLLYEDCLIRIPHATLAPKRGAFFLTRHLPLHPGDRVLDLGTGSGLVGLVAARRGHQVVATDIVPECCECARTNGLLNGLAEQLTVRAGDLFAAVTGERFDVIATNPPQMPTPPGYAWDDAQARADNGGLDGWAVLGPIIQEAPAYLEPGGRLVFTLFGFLGVEQAFERCRRAGLRPGLLARKEQPFPRIARERLEHLRALDPGSARLQGCPATCDRLVLCGEKASPCPDSSSSTPTTST